MSQSDDDFDGATDAFVRTSVPKSLPKQRAAFLKALGMESSGAKAATRPLPADALKQFLPFVDAQTDNDSSFDFGTVLSTTPQKVGHPAAISHS